MIFLLYFYFHISVKNDALMRRITLLFTCKEKYWQLKVNNRILVLSLMREMNNGLCRKTNLSCFVTNNSGRKLAQQSRIKHTYEMFGKYSQQCVLVSCRGHYTLSRYNFGPKKSPFFWNNGLGNRMMLLVIRQYTKT